MQNNTSTSESNLSAPIRPTNRRNLEIHTGAYSDDGALAGEETLDDNQLQFVDTKSGENLLVNADQPVTPHIEWNPDVEWPVVATAQFIAQRIELPESGGVTFIREPDFHHRKTAVEGKTPFSGESIIEFNLHPKLYVHTEGEGQIVAKQESIGRGDRGRKILEMDEPTEITVGGRPMVEANLGTLTIPETTEGVRKALDWLGDPIRTDSPARVWPTLRPPTYRIEVGDSFDLPDSDTPSQSGIELALPDSLAYLYPATTAAYYLNAEVVSNQTPELRIPAYDIAKSLPKGEAFVDALRELVDGIFMLDATAREPEGVGFYDMSTIGGRAVRNTDEFDIDWETVYDWPLNRRIKRYLGDPLSVAADTAPPRPVGFDIAESTAHAPILSDAADWLATVKTHSPRSITTGMDALVQPEPLDAIHECYVGEGVPKGAERALPEGYQHAQAQRPAQPPEVVVVYPPDEFDAEGETIRDYYETIPSPDFDLTEYTDLTVAGLRELLENEGSHLHFIGHMTSRGLKCTDGWLDTTTLETVAPLTFFLNGCSSFNQGAALVEQGAAGGIVSRHDIRNRPASDFGTALIRCLGIGTTLGMAVNLATYTNPLSEKYMVIGNGRARMNPTVEMDSIVNVTRQPAEEAYHIGYVSPSGSYGHRPGALNTPTAEDGETVHSNAAQQFTLDESQMARLVEHSSIPMIVDGDLMWPDELRPELPARPTDDE